MAKDIYYTDMKEMISRVRRGAQLINEETQPNPNIVSDKGEELKNQVMNSENEGIMLTLDQNKEATIIADAQSIDENIKIFLQQKLNGYIKTVGSFTTSIDKITVHIEDSSLLITIQVIMDGNQPAVLNVNTAKQDIQLKYDNFLQLTEKNINFMKASTNHFNPALMSELTGLTKVK